MHSEFDLSESYFPILDDPDNSLCVTVYICDLFAYQKPRCCKNLELELQKICELCFDYFQLCLDRGLTLNKDY